MKRGSLLLALALVLALLPAAPAQATGSLEATTSHTLVAPPVFENDRWMLAWQGEITGDVDGYIEWWIDTQNWTQWDNIVNNLPQDPIGYYIEKVRVYDAPGGTLLLEAISRGETNLMTMSWWANGEIVFADPTLFPGVVGRGLLETGMFDLTTMPPSGTSTFEIVSEPLVTGLVLVDAKTDQDVGPLFDGAIVNLGTTPMFNIRAETAPNTVGSVGFALTDADGKAVHFRLDGQLRENFPPYAVGGDWPVGNYLPMTLGLGTYTLKVTPYSGGSLTGVAGPTYEVTFTVAEPFTGTYAGEITAVTVDPALVAARCSGPPAWGYVTFAGTGESDLFGSFSATAENCSYVGPLPDGTIGPNGTYGEGTILITTEAGDVINGTYTNGMTLVPPPMTEFADSWTLTGGTGRFAAVSGSGTEMGIADLTMGPVPGAPFTVTMEGVISY